jgi:hypothetical protein
MWTVVEGEDGRTRTVHRVGDDLGHFLVAEQNEGVALGLHARQGEM